MQKLEQNTTIKGNLAMEPDLRYMYNGEPLGVVILNTTDKTVVCYIKGPMAEDFMENYWEPGTVVKFFGSFKQRTYMKENEERRMTYFAVDRVVDE